LPFLPLLRFVAMVCSFQILNSSRAARFGNVTFRVMGGQSGKKWQCDRAALAGMALAGIGFRTKRYVIVQVLPP